MKAFRAPGFVEGTFGLEALLDELAAKLDLDPLELRRRNHADHDAADGRPFTSKNLLECYRRAEPHWERRHEVRARSTETVKRGVGMASQIWYGGGGPPSYAWVRVGSDGRATVVTAMQDIGTGTKTAMAQIAAEELGVPLDARHRLARRLRRAGRTRRSQRRLVDDARRWGRRCALPRPTRASRSRRSPSSAATPGAPIAGDRRVLEDAQILGKGARGPNPTGHAGAHVRRAGGRGRRRRRDRRGLGRADRGGARRRPRDQPARRVEPDRGRDHPGHRPHALRERLHDPRTGAC